MCFFFSSSSSTKIALFESLSFLSKSNSSSPRLRMRFNKFVLFFICAVSSLYVFSSSASASSILFMNIFSFLVNLFFKSSTNADGPYTSRFSRSIRLPNRSICLSLYSLCLCSLIYSYNLISCSFSFLSNLILTSSAFSSSILISSSLYLFIN